MEASGRCHKLQILEMKKRNLLFANGMILYINPEQNVELGSVFTICCLILLPYRPSSATLNRYNDHEHSCSMLCFHLELFFLILFILFYLFILLMTQIYLQNKNRLTDIKKNKCTVTKREIWGRGINQEFGINIHTLRYESDNKNSL